MEDSSLCFINNHLASGQKHPVERTRDIIEILERRSHFPWPTSSTRLAFVGCGDGTQVADHELTFFAGPSSSEGAELLISISYNSGDLNFRINLPREQVISAVARGDGAALLPFDQLKIELAQNPSFRLRSFLEAPLLLDSTYKYDHGTATYDTSKKLRVPSWCDRILYRSEPQAKITPLEYLRYEADISDHRVRPSFRSPTASLTPPSLSAHLRLVLSADQIHLARRSRGSLEKSCSGLGKGRGGVAGDSEEVLPGWNELLST